MRELKLKYIIELASNIGSKARAEAQALEQSQQAMQRAVDKTTATVGRLDSAFMRFAANSATERQIGYMSRLGAGIDQVATKMRSLAALTAKGLQAAPAAVAAGAGAFYTAKALLDKPMDYSLRLARMSNTAFSDRNTAGRIAGKAELNEAIMGAVRGGSIPRDDAAAALNALIGSGAMSIDEAKALLPTLTKGAAGSGATAVQLGSVAIRAKQNMQIPLTDIASVLDEANAAGKAGGFELEDMAKSLPQAMAAGRQSGLTGREGFRKIVAMMQASVITAGTKDEAANNVVNLLAKVNSADTEKDFKKQGYDLRGELVKGRASGMDSVDTFVSLVDKIAGKDKGYTALQGKLAAAKDDAGRTETLSSMADILQGKAIGNVVQDRQALMSLVAVMNNRKYLADIQQKMRDGKGSLGEDFSVISGETSYKATALGNEKDNAQSAAFIGKSGVLNTMLDKVTDLAREFPTVTMAATGAATALTVLSAAAGIFSLLAMRNAGGLGLPGRAGGLAGGLGGPGAYPVLEGAAPAAAAGGLGALGVGAGVVTGGAAASFAATEQLANNKNLRDAVVGNMFGGDMSFAAAILSANDAPVLADNHRGKGFNDPRLLSLTTPGITEQALAAGSATKIEMGEGKLMIDVRVTNDGQVTATPLVTQQPALMKLSGGSTNPGSVR